MNIETEDDVKSKTSLVVKMIVPALKDTNFLMLKNELINFCNVSKINLEDNDFWLEHLDNAVKVDFFKKIGVNFEKTFKCSFIDFEVGLNRDFHANILVRLQQEIFRRPQYFGKVLWGFVKRHPHLLEQDVKIDEILKSNNQIQAITGLKTSEFMAYFFVKNNNHREGFLRKVAKFDEFKNSIKNNEKLKEFTAFKIYSHLFYNASRQISEKSQPEYGYSFFQTSIQEYVNLYEEKFPLCNKSALQNITYNSQFFKIMGVLIKRGHIDKDDLQDEKFWEALSSKIFKINAEGRKADQLIGNLKEIKLIFEYLDAQNIETENLRSVIVLKSKEALLSPYSKNSVLPNNVSHGNNLMEFINMNQALKQECEKLLLEFNLSKQTTPKKLVL